MRHLAANDAVVRRTPSLRRLEALLMMPPFSRCAAARLAITGSHATLLLGALTEILQVRLAQRRIPRAAVLSFLVPEPAALLLLVAAAERQQQHAGAKADPGE
jgi:hypothetical protein